jgi:hypothetical protein
MFKFINYLFYLLIFSNVNGYGFEMEFKNSSSFSYIVNTSKLRNIEISNDGHRISKIEIKPGESRKVDILFLTNGRNAEYGDIVFSKAGIFGCKLATISFVTPEFSNYVIPSLNRVCYLVEFINKKKGFVVKKTFDHERRRYLFEIRKIEEDVPIAADSDTIPLLHTGM